MSTTLLKVGVCNKWQMGHDGHISDCVPPTSDDHIFRVRTSFWVFLDSMKSPLSQDYFNVHVEGSG